MPVSALWILLCIYHPPLWAADSHPTVPKTVRPMGKFNTVADLVITPPNSQSSGCDLTIAGFDSKESFLYFFDQLKIASAQNNAKALSNLVLFPLRLNGIKSKIIRNRSQFQKNYKIIFTSKIRDVIAQQKLEKLFCRDQGVMFGDGQLWISVNSKKQVGIIAINSH